MKNLNLYDIKHINTIVSPENFDQTTLNSPATKVFTDFKDYKALVIEGSTLATDALKTMMRTHVQMKIVVDRSNNFLGIISTKELSEERLISEIAKGFNRDELLVSDLMLPRHQLSGFDYDQLKKVKVKDVVETLKNNGLNHCLVVDSARNQIRGLISSSDIARKLHLPINIDTKTSFMKIFEAVHHVAELKIA